MGETSVTSPGNVPALPEWAGEEIFTFLEDRYGAKFIDSLGGIPRQRVMLAWREDLVGYTPREIKRGLNACRTLKWPPICPEFQLLCRPQADAKTEWAEAREQMALRLRGAGGDVWSRPQVYWAALKIGNYDLQTLGWETVRQRWERALAAASAEPVPDWVNPAPALPKPGDQGVTREVARQRSSLLSRQVAERATLAPSNGWAVALLRREAAGDQVELVAEGAWRAVLGFAPDVPAVAALREIEARSIQSGAAA